MSLRARDIYKLGREAGWRGEKLQTASAIALNFSRGNSNIIKSSPTGNRYGLFGLSEAEVQGRNWQEPAVNAALAFRGYKAANYRFKQPEFTTGSYKESLRHAIGGMMYYYLEKYDVVTNPAFTPLDAGMFFGTNGLALESTIGLLVPDPAWGTHFEPRRIAEFAFDAGWRNDEENLIKAVASCLGESNGYEKRIHENTNSAGEVVSHDLGLWQVNFEAHMRWTWEDLMTATINAQAAYAIYKGRQFTFNAWVAYTKHLSLVFANDPAAEADYKKLVRYAIQGVVNFFNEKNGFALMALPNE
jgi:hypothetical protein